MDRPGLAPHDGVGNRVQTQNPRRASRAPGEPEQRVFGAGGDRKFRTESIHMPNSERTVDAAGRWRQVLSRRPGEGSGTGVTVTEHRNLPSTSNPNGAQRRAAAWASGSPNMGHGDPGTERAAVGCVSRPRPWAALAHPSSSSSEGGAPATRSPENRRAHGNLWNHTVLRGGANP